ncbi:MAG: FKBP-type peptidyl-prolyl cis-trans isomerase [Holophaga sp.]
MRAHVLIALALLTAATFGCKPPQSAQPAWSTSPSGLGVVDLVPGTGPAPRFTQTVVVEAIGWVEEKGQKGHVFLNTRKRGYPDVFPLGVGRVIKGWDEGLATMKQGGKRLLRVPPALGYGPRELGKDIPPGATVIFEVELVNLR